VPYLPIKKLSNGVNLSVFGKQNQRLIIALCSLTTAHRAERLCFCASYFKAIWCYRRNLSQAGRTDAVWKVTAGYSQSKRGWFD
jgi:hypothetical protein